jgi:hypothetical protein
MSRRIQLGTYVRSRLPDGRSGRWKGKRRNVYKVATVSSTSRVTIRDSVIYCGV